MAWAYFDTSALVKRYVNESGRREVLQLLRRHDVVTSALLPVELQSALRRHVSEGTLEAADREAIRRHIATDRGYWTLVAAGLEVLASAEALVATHPLCTLDAIHLASAQLFRSRVPAGDFVFISADARQTAAAAAVGLTARRIEA